MLKQQWFKFWVSNWRSDPKLRMCSVAARGVWIEMICLMHEADPYGLLLIEGERPTNKQLANQLGCQLDELEPALAELEKYGVFSRRNNGTIYSRKMVKLRAISKKRSEAVSTRYQKEEPPAETEPPKVKPQAKEGEASGNVSFTAFWSEWPNKVSKKSAESAWRKLSEADRQAALGTLQSWWEIWRRRHPDAAPIHPATYLKNRRWEDDFGGVSAQMDPDIARWAGMK